uniref:ATP-dependent RNA helicase Ski2/MTR4 C-terminal domain-containing protein n=1 Tax=Proboscia inermis TaxID=420281 RepID=A0A7S0GGK2_9STRA
MSDVVTAWTAGCTWSEALEMSGKAPGDLARLLHRSLDALRQLGNLPYNAVRVRNENYPSEPSGIHPEIRRICKDAAMEMARYPLKDPLPFDEEENVDEEAEEENVDEEAEENSPNDVIAENSPDDDIEGESLSHDITG